MKRCKSASSDWTNACTSDLSSTHTQESFPSEAAEFNLWVEKQLSEKDVARGHVMAELASHIEANYHALIEGMQNVQVRACVCARVVGMCAKGSQAPGCFPLMWMCICVSHPSCPPPQRQQRHTPKGGGPGPDARRRAVRHQPAEARHRGARGPGPFAPHPAQAPPPREPAARRPHRERRVCVRVWVCACLCGYLTLLHIHARTYEQPPAPYCSWCRRPGRRRRTGAWTGRWRRPRRRGGRWTGRRSRTPP